MSGLLEAGRKLQRSQLSVQGLARLCSVSIFLLASWADTDRLALVALQGTLLALPYTLMESLVGRPISAGLVPAGWSLDAWARRVAAAAMLPVGVIGFLSASLALPDTGIVDRLIMVAPVVLQLPLEALFWSTARTRSPQRANLIPQLAAVGTVLTGVAFAAAGFRVDVAAAPAQLAVLAWVLAAGTTGPDRARPGVLASLRVGSAYLVAAAVDLAYAVALPSVAGAIAGQPAVVVLRALDLAFGPFHVALSASTREDIVAGRHTRWRTGTRGLTVAALLAVSTVVLASDRVRALLADDLAAAGTTVVALYCAYKAFLAAATWLATRHMIWAPPRRFLISAIGSRTIAFGGLAVSAVLANQVRGLVAQLLVSEVLVVGWFLARMFLGTRTRGGGIPAVAPAGAAAPASVAAPARSGQP
ncbi:hypothetical protein GCE86_00170 [Micromonospora terminaliae]|uniref:Polysaccharide biosynthesis protein n=1 Tax=Micromonospora terminaliae TaxID=1914461 RepID=A0AAJ2ZJ61_9ACTN|nr:hypothetical protein [Micromonospora terminaliae]NES30898.1 hypothetical protein [Micromonospora terminaliae]QGL45598.1 hypothetical protein GCE86_00170 [Micromonospora terminaliae]